MSYCTTRFAPSPTGTLHLGNARTFLTNWALARQRGWRVIMRIEDLDVQRVRPGASQAILETFRWLGIDFDGPPVWQSHDLSHYQSELRKLTESGQAYSCSLTRSQIQAAVSAPHAGDAELRFPPQLRPSDPDAFRFDDANTNYRLVVADETIEIHDCFAGLSLHRPFAEVGDFIIWTKLGVPAYQLAVVVDDARQGVTDVVRGDDLLPSAARQVLLYRALGLKPPRWWHLPLVLGEDGRRLAKRHGDTHLETFRNRGVPPQRIIGLLGYWSGVSDDRRELTLDEFEEGFRIDRFPRSPVTFTIDDQQWLLKGAQARC